MLTFGISPYFTPSAAAGAGIGGLLLGTTVIFKSGVVGRVLGISTYTKRLFVKPCADRYAMILGLVLAGVFMSALYGGTEPIPPRGLSAQKHTYLFVRLVLGGALIGAGSTLQNGCTSGHGLTGLARLSLRSWVAVPTFMAAGVVTATLSGSARALPADAATEADAPSWTTALLLATCAAAVLGLLACLARWVGPASEEAARDKPSGGVPSAQKILTLASELLVGLSFGCGLVISGMSRPSKVAAFLDLGSGTWDPSLAFVMGGALLLTFPFFQVMHFRGVERPILGGPLEWPSRQAPVDRSLVAGALLFGTGWGTCGMCPGPIWVALGAMPSLEVGAVLLGMLIGMATVVVAKERRAVAATASTTQHPVEVVKVAVAGKEPGAGEAVDKVVPEDLA